MTREMDTESEPCCPRLRGIVSLTTLAAADALVAASVRSKIKDEVMGARAAELFVNEETQLHLSASEDTMIEALKREFTGLKPEQRGLLHRFPADSQDSCVCRCATLYRPVRTSGERECAASGCYLIDVDIVYTNPKNIFEELHKRWTTLTEGLSCREGALVSLIPDVILVVLHSPDVAARKTLGSMLPSLVRALPDDTNLKEGERDDSGRWEARICGFPPSYRVKLSPNQLNRLYTGSPQEGSARRLKECGWMTASCRKCTLKSTWCSAHVVSVDFLQHSLFFLDWCVPEDFYFIPRWSTLRGEEPTTDVLARLLLDVTKHAASGTIPAERVPQGRPRLNIDIMGKRSRELDGISRILAPWTQIMGTQSVQGDEEAISLPKGSCASVCDDSGGSCTGSKRCPCGKAGWESRCYGQRMKTISDLKKNVDINFVDGVYAAVAAVPQQRLAMEGLLGQLEMMEEVFSSLSVLQPYGVTAAPLCPTGARPGDSRDNMASRRTLQLLHQLETRRGGCPSRNDPNAVFSQSGGVRRPLDDSASVFETLREKFAACAAPPSFPADGAGAGPSRPFLLSRDGERMLEPPFISGEAPGDISDVSAELADVAEARCNLDIVVACEGGANAGAGCSITSLPSGKLKDKLRMSMMSFVSHPPVSGLGSFTVGDVELRGNRIDCGDVGQRCTVARNYSPKLTLELLGAGFNNNLKLFGCGNDLEGRTVCNPFSPRQKPATLSEFWGSVAEEVRGAMEVSTDSGMEGASDLNEEVTRTLDETVGGDLLPLGALLKDAACSECPTVPTRGDLWLRHIAFLLSHACFSGVVSTSRETANRCGGSERISVENVKQERHRRVLRGLEGHFFFLDSALCALDMAISKRWGSADGELRRRRLS